MHSYMLDCVRQCSFSAAAPDKRYVLFVTPTDCNVSRKEISPSIIMGSGRKNIWPVCGHYPPECLPIITPNNSHEGGARKI